MSKPKAEEVRLRDDDLTAISDDIEYYSRPTVDKILDAMALQNTALPKTLYEDFEDPDTDKIETITRPEVAFRLLNYSARLFHFFTKKTTSLEMKQPLTLLSKALDRVSALLFIEDTTAIPRRLRATISRYPADPDNPAHIDVLGADPALPKEVWERKFEYSLDQEIKYFNDLKARVETALDAAKDAPKKKGGPQKPELHSFIGRLFGSYRLIYGIEDFTCSENGPAVRFIKACLKNFPFDQVQGIEDKIPVLKVRTGSEVSLEKHPSVNNIYIYNFLTPICKKLEKDSFEKNSDPI